MREICVVCQRPLPYGHRGRYCSRTCWRQRGHQHPLLADPWRLIERLNTAPTLSYLADATGISRTTLWAALRRYGITREVRADGTLGPWGIWHWRRRGQWALIGTETPPPMGKRRPGRGSAVSRARGRSAIRG